MKTLFSHKGVAAVEFALILPLLLVILFGIIEFSILMYDKQMITNASREGARTGILFQGMEATSVICEEPSGIKYCYFSDDKIDEVVDNYLKTYLISFPGSGTAEATIQVSPASRQSGDLLTIRVDYTYNFLVLSNLLSLVGGGSGSNIPLSATTIMRME